MADSVVMSDRVLAFVNEIGDAGMRDPAREVVVLSPWWTAGPGTPPGISAIRPLAQTVLRAIDLPGTSIDGLDRWAATAGLPVLFHLDGIAWWDRVRMAVRWDVYELVLWRHVLALLDPVGRFDRVLVPVDRPHLAAACRAMGLVVELPVPDAAGSDPTAGEAADDVTEPGDDPPAVAVQRGPSIADPARQSSSSGPAGIWRCARRLGGRVLRRAPFVPESLRRLTPRQRLDLRTRRLAARRSVLVITWAGAFQVMPGRRAERLGDPFLDPAIDRLGERGEPTTVAIMGRSHQNASHWPTIAADPRMVPFSYIRARWRAAEDAALDSLPIAVDLAGRPVPAFDVAGCDIAPAVIDLVKGYAGPWLDERRRWYHTAGRFLDELRPRAMLIDREGTRAPWIAAAQERGIPVVTVQHGMVYPGNPEYFAPRRPGSLRPNRTCVFGSYERDLLVNGAGYEPAEVVVTGSPRVSDRRRGPMDPRRRGAVRGELGVAPGDRVLVVSAAHNPIGELLTAGMLATVLDGPLPGVHVVVKLHPQDRAQPDYAGLLAGIAAAGGYDAPAVSVVRDIDLLQLLAAADAHLGHSSTVLTDAVAAGLPNMVAMVQAHADPIGCVKAGVAVAVRDVSDVRAFMDDPRPPDAGARDAFLEAHFREGDATGRLIDVLLRATTLPVSS